MKPLLIAIALDLIGCGAVYCQTATDPIYGQLIGASTRGNRALKPKTTPEENDLAFVRRIMRSPSPLKESRVPLHRMGDLAAVLVLRVLQGRPPLSQAEKQTVLDALHQAYEMPEAIGVPSREPTATLALLQQIDESTPDGSLKRRVLDTQDFVLAAGSQFK